MVPVTCDAVPLVPKEANVIATNQSLFPNVSPTSYIASIVASATQMLPDRDRQGAVAADKNLPVKP